MIQETDLFRVESNRRDRTRYSLVSAPVSINYLEIGATALCEPWPPLQPLQSPLLGYGTSLSINVTIFGYFLQLLPTPKVLAASLLGCEPGVVVSIPVRKIVGFMGVELRPSLNGCVCEKKMLREIHERTEGRIILNEGLHNFYSSSSFVRTVNARRMQYLENGRNKKYVHNFNW
jgi:hypothetical protein